MNWLEEQTGQSSAWWMATVQRLIGKHSTPPPKGKKHGTTDVTAWLTDLVKMVERRFPPDGQYDENMKAAAVLSQVLALWYLRVHRAKALDSARPISHRQSAYLRRQEYVVALLLAAMDEREDAAYFPGQRWQLPFTPDATSGDFV